MAKEIERKFKVINNSYKQLAFKKHEIVQAYLSDRKEATVRVRIRDNEAFLTVKGVNHGIERSEWEYSIPVDEARSIIKECCNAVLSKTRHLVDYGEKIWEIDEFHGHLEGLVLAEVELSAPDEPIVIPDFAGEDVSNNAQYYNTNLIKHISR